MAMDFDDDPDNPDTHEDGDTESDTDVVQPDENSN